MPRIVATAVLAMMVIATWASVAGPCSCAGDRSPQFLVPSGVTFPSDFRGVPCINLKDVPRSGVSVIDLDVLRDFDPRRRTATSFEIETPSFPAEYARTKNPWQRGETGRYDNGSLFLICAQWRAGATYRISIQGGASVLIHVSTQPFVESPHKIEIWQNERSLVVTSTARGSCETAFDGSRVGVELAGESVGLWRDSLLYMTVVDDTLTWRPEFDICSDVPAGRSWVGVARELLYGGCASSEQERMSFGALWNLTPGYHTVKMIGWLPGVAQVSAKGTVFIDCKEQN